MTRKLVNVKEFEKRTQSSKFDFQLCFALLEKFTQMTKCHSFEAFTQRRMN